MVESLATGQRANISKTLSPHANGLGADLLWTDGHSLCRLHHFSVSFVDVIRLPSSLRPDGSNHYWYRDLDLLLDSLTFSIHQCDNIILQCKVAPFIN